MPLLDVPGVCPVNVVQSRPRPGAPIILLHPVGLDLTWWGAQFERFSAEHEVVAFDMPGHGMSHTPDRPPSFDLMADVLRAVVERFDGQSVHLVGLSVGGMIAQAFALRKPELVRSLSLVATLCTFPDDVRGAIRERARVARTEGMAKIAQLSNERWFPTSFRQRRPDVLDRVEKILKLHSGDFHAAMWEMISALDFEPHLSEIRCPTLVVSGAEDINAPIAAAEKIVEKIPGAALRIMPGIGHFPPFEDAEAFNTILSEFILSTDV